MQKFANIPIELCTFALKEHKVNQVRLFVYLKTICDGNIKFYPFLKEKVCMDLGYKTPKTFISNLNWLISNNWIFVNDKTKVHNIISYERLTVLLKFKSGKGAVYEPLDFSLFKEFLVSAVVTNYMSKKRRMDKRGERSKGRSGKKRIPSSLSYNLPLVYFAKILNISKTHASNLIKLAAKSPWIDVNHSYEKLNFSVDQKDLLKKYSDYEANKIVIKDDCLCIQNPNIITSYVHLRRKRPIRILFSKMEKK